MDKPLQYNRNPIPFSVDSAYKTKEMCQQMIEGKKVLPVENIIENQIKEVKQEEYTQEVKLPKQALKLRDREEAFQSGSQLRFTHH